MRGGARCGICGKGITVQQTGTLFTETWHMIWIGNYGNGSSATPVRLPSPAPDGKGIATGPPGDPVQTRERQKLSVLTVLGFGAAAALAVLVLMSYIQLMGISNSVVSLKSQLEDLETENVTLTTQYERMYDLSTVQEAAEAAGMSKPSGSQIYYIDLSDGDSAVVYQQKEPDVLSRLLTSLHHGVYAVVEYFE